MIVFAGVIVLFLMFVALYLGVGTLLILTVERWLQSRLDQRDGREINGEFDLFQVLKDFLKAFDAEHFLELKKNRSNDLALMLSWFLLPFLFFATGLASVWFSFFRSSGLLLPLVAAAIATQLETFAVAPASSAIVVDSFRKKYILKNLGLTGLFISLVVVSVHLGSSDLNELSRLQNRFPYAAIFRSPSMFAVFFCSLFSMYHWILFSSDKMPSTPQTERSQIFKQIHERLWLFSFASFFSLVFLGGISNILAMILFPVKAFIVCMAILFLNITIPRSKTSDTIGTFLQWGITSAVLCLLLETAWIGFFK